MKDFLLLTLGKLSRWIRDVLSDDGNQSTTRLVMVAAWFCVLLVWTVVSLAKHELVEIPRSVLELVGIITLGKCWQNHTEASR